MQRYLFLFVAMIAGACFSEAVWAANSPNLYERCAAISTMNAAGHPKAKWRELYALDRNLYTGWVAWFYPGDIEGYKAALESAIQTIRADLDEKRLTPEEYAEESVACNKLAVKTVNIYMGCIKMVEPTDENNAKCARAAVGIVR